jgi:hypothetical protein
VRRLPWNSSTIGDPEPYTGGRNFGYLAYAVDNIYDICSAFIAHGVTIKRPPRDGGMVLIRRPGGIFIQAAIRFRNGSLSANSPGG